MIRKANIRPAWVVILLFMLFFLIYSGIYQTEVTEVVYNKPSRESKIKVAYQKFKYSEENEHCFKCHGQSKYTYENSENGKTETKKMYTEAIIDRDEFYISNHREFRCTDCHSEDYSTFPHPGTLRMEAIATCIDCHGGDEKYAHFKFDQIDTAFMASVHSEKHSEDFTCWMCHDPHTYKINARNSDNLKETIAYDNMICLNCHSDITEYELLTDKLNPNILDKHEWLPNQVAHFTNVRCIECHARNEDTLIVAHHVVPKNMAVKKCESCHSKNSILYASLYKYQIQENIEKQGLIKGLFFSETSSIGPDQNNNLNIVSFVIFGLTITVIAIHAILRFKINR